MKRFEAIEAAFLLGLLDGARVYRRRKDGHGWLVIDGAGVAWIVEQRAARLEILAVTDRRFDPHAHGNDRWDLSHHAEQRSHGRLGCRAPSRALATWEILKLIKNGRPLFSVQLGTTAYVSVDGTTAVIEVTGTARLRVITVYQTDEVPLGQWLTSCLERLGRAPIWRVAGE